LPEGEAQKEVFFERSLKLAPEFGRLQLGANIGVQKVNKVKGKRSGVKRYSSQRYAMNMSCLEESTRLWYRCRYVP
jgi:hypothetical protein